MKVSQVTVTLNKTETVKHCIASVNEQTWDNIENIVIDDVSSSETLKPIEKTTNRVQKVISVHDTGIYNALSRPYNPWQISQS